MHGPEPGVEAEPIAVNLTGGFLGIVISIDGTWVGDDEAFQPGDAALDFSGAKDGVVEDELLHMFWGGHAGIAVGAGVGTTALVNDAGIGLSFPETSIGLEVLAGAQWMRIAVPIDVEE